MQLIQYAGATLFVLLAGTANVLFGLQLGHGPVDTTFWVVVGIASAIWTVSGVELVVRQHRARHYGRMAAAGLLLCCALGYDVLAAYGLARAEQRQAIAAQQGYAGRIAAVGLEVARYRAQVAALPVVTPVQAEALRASVTVTHAQCVEVTAPNKLTRAQADRIRSGCKARAEALQAVAAADARIRALAALSAAEARLGALHSAPPPIDARAELLPPQWVAWAPVILITSGALFGAFGAGATHTAPPVPAVPVSAAVPVVEPDNDHDDPGAAQRKAKLLSLAGGDAADVAPLKKTSDGYVRGNQRTIAKMLGEPLVAINRTLREMADARMIELDTRNGTAFRIAA